MRTTSVLCACWIVLSGVGCRVPEPVPVPCPEPPHIQEPILPITQWQPGKFTQAEVEKLLWQSLALKVGESKALREALNAYRKPVEKKAK